MLKKNFFSVQEFSSSWSIFESVSKRITKNDKKQMVLKFYTGTGNPFVFQTNKKCFLKKY